MVTGGAGLLRHIRHCFPSPQKPPQTAPTCPRGANRLWRWRQSALAVVAPRCHDGKRFVIGLEHWALHDPQPSNWLDDENFGLLTSRDNAYDGVEARRKRAVLDGKHVGGEYGDYGNLMQPLSAFLRELK